MTAPANTVHTFCRYCLASCGVEVTVRDNRVTKISADRENPHSWHDFCAKGRTAAEVVDHPRRVVAPMRRVGDSYVETSWAEAIADIAERCNAIIDEDGPDAVGAYYGNPAGYSSSNLVFFNAWLDAVGTYNRYAVGSVDQNAVHVVAEAMYGSPLMVPVSDIDHCDYFLLVGANPAVSAWNWLETVPGGWRRALERRRRGATIVVVDPVRTETAEKADLHLAVRPGQDWALLLAMVKVILDEGREHPADCADLATGVDDLRRLVADADLDDLAARCDIPRARIEDVARDLAGAPAAMVVTRTGVSLHAAGTVAEWLGHVLNVITGRMDRPGGRRFEPGYVDTLRLADLAKTPPHTSRLTGRGHGRGRARAGRPARRDRHTGAWPDPGAGDQQRQSRGVRSRRWPARCGPGTARPVGRHRLRAAGKPSPRPLDSAGGALAGAQRSTGVHQRHARRAFRPVRRARRGAPARRARGVADLHRSGHRHGQAAVQGAWTQHLHHHHPGDWHG